MTCPYCEEGFTVFRSDFHDGKGSRKLHRIIGEDGDEQSVFCKNNGWLSRHRLLTIGMVFLVLWALAAVFSV